MSLLTRCRRGGIAAALACAVVAAATPAAHAASGQLLVEVGRLSDGSSAGVNPATVVSALSHNEGAGGKWGVDAPGYLGGYDYFTFSPPAGTSIAATRIWPTVSAYGWPAMGTYTTVTSSWGDWNVGGNPGAVNYNGLWSQGGGGLTTGAVASVIAQANQTGTGGGSPQTGYFYADKLDVTLADANPPTVDQAPAAGALFGSPNASGWYTAATLPVTLKASDQGSGVRWLLLKDGSTVHKYALPGTGASCATKDPNASLMGGDTYTVKVPCPTASASYTVNVDMTTIGDGVHSLQIGTMDASGRSTYDAAYSSVQVNAPGMNPSPDGGTGLNDPGATGPGGCIYQDDGTCPLPPINTTAPSITGTPKRGQATTVDVGYWTNITAATWGYQWQRCTSTDTSTCVNIVAANGATYTPALADVDKRLRALVTPTTTGGSVTTASNITHVVADSAAAGSTPESGGGTAPALGGGGFGGGGGGGGGDASKPTTTTDPTTPTASGTPSPKSRGQQNGDCTCDPAMLENADVKAVFATTKTTALSTTYGKGAMVTGRVTTKAGDAVRNAWVHVTAKLADGSQFDDRNVRTDADGKFTLSLPSNVLAQTVRIAYLSHMKDDDAADTEALTLKVKATAALTVSTGSKKAASARKHGAAVVRDGSWLTFRVVVNGPIPVGGKTVQIQSTCTGSAACKQGWVPIGPDNQRTNSKGVYIWRVKAAGNSGTVRFRFRAVVPKVDGASNDWPFDTGYSPAKSLTIKGKR